MNESLLEQRVLVARLFSLVSVNSLFSPMPITMWIVYLEDLEGAHEGLVHRHHGARVVELAAVVGRGEQRHQLSLREELVAVLNHLRKKEIRKLI